ncbi:rhomboid family intramembrane serine protease [Microscilla marina]|uniref:Cytoplasmic membrane protein n=1 Tax=Microscilla marina ATCC 23134 TaxID=313606 RepID=A1ZEX5_MICM2|nr:rhomboid family intramembrane serine protease [Microscilla marina]EAY31077.1 cytoplasmic membrane protein [Microscilla marina ATCC 23134]
MNDFVKPDGNIYLSVIIIAITVGISLYADKNRLFKSKWIFNPYIIESRKEYYRFLSSGFIHGGSTHLLFNMLTLFFFARQVELIYGAVFPGYGSIMFVVIYLAGIIIASIPAYVKHRGNPAYNALGASGGVSTIVFVSILCLPTSNIGFLLLPFVSFPAFFLGIAYLLYSYYMAKNSNDNIGHEAHLFGALFGIATTIAFVPGVVPRFFEAIANWKGFF